MKKWNKLFLGIFIYKLWPIKYPCFFLQHGGNYLALKKTELTDFLTLSNKQNMSNILILSQTDIDLLLSQGDPKVANEIIDLMQTTFVKFTQGHDDQVKALQAQSPQRIGISTDSHKVLFMPSRLDTTTSIKIVSVPTKEGLSGLPASILVLDESTGCVQAVMNAGALTAVRTAAGK